MTKDGVFGNSTHIPTNQLISDFHNSGCKVFHLMGDAPAIYLEQWTELLNNLNGEIFHSDFVLLEGEYNPLVLNKIAQYNNSLYAVSIKGFDEEEYKTNTNTDINMSQLWHNLDIVVNTGVNFYFTFTGMSIDKFKDLVLKRYKDESLLNDSFAIDLVHYNALDYIQQNNE